MSSFNNPPLLSGQNAHGGVALFWKHAFDDYITPLTNIHSDRIVGIKCDFDNNSPLYILSVYLPTSSQKDIDFLEYFSHLWALYDSLSVKGYVILMGDFNGELGNSLGEKSAREPNQRSLKLLEMADYFNLCPINLFGLCDGRTDTFISHCGKYCSTLDYIFVPNWLFDEIYSAKTFDLSVENTSDHLLIMIKLNQSKIPDCTSKEYRLLLRNFLNNLESDKVKKLCNAAESDEKLFWKPLKGQWPTSQMSAFLVENKLITDKILLVKCGPIILKRLVFLRLM